MGLQFDLEEISLFNEDAIYCSALRLHIQKIPAVFAPEEKKKQMRFSWHNMQDAHPCSDKSM